MLCDTGAILDYLVADAPDHAAFRAAIEGARTRFVPGLVLAEVDYFLRAEREAMAAFMADLERGAFTYVAPTMALLGRAMAIDRAHRGLGLGLVDASIVALAELIGVRRIATRDVRHFSSARLQDGGGFDLVVIPERPEQ